MLYCKPSQGRPLHEKNMPLREVPVPSRLRRTANFYKSVIFSQAGPGPVQPLCPGLQILISRLYSAELFRFGIRHRKRLQVETKIFFGSSKKIQSKSNQKYNWFWVEN